MWFSAVYHADTDELRGLAPISEDEEDEPDFLGSSTSSLEKIKMFFTKPERAAGAWINTFNIPVLLHEDWSIQSEHATPIIMIICVILFCFHLYIFLSLLINVLSHLISRGRSRLTQFHVFRVFSQVFFRVVSLSIMVLSSMLSHVFPWKPFTIDNWFHTSQSHSRLDVLFRIFVSSFPFSQFKLSSSNKTKFV